MILNLSKIKTEALLLFCKDLIDSYIDKEEHLFNIDEELDSYINKISKDMLKQINIATLPTKYYIENRNHYRIKAVLNAYNFINKELTIELKKGKAFNPSMLYFSFLAVWFKELDKESKSKEYIYFTIYPYTNVYDKLLINIKDEKFKLLNIKMLEIAEKVVYKLDKLSLKA
ncbi:hypothetical protein CRV08_09115 [Halarcobacter ebronensis]|uniref:Uncharacterized protein n=1 Tax=Halarcobacter ebronensis TaxID=1462615 RepID=A0A4Q0YG02_9BACT|nr:hypothetical protein [Halarcobacter ebronensis]QKF80830.1 hypothetical protein AEBR_0314 [Halarcobacter ebronensis]RXJ67959.1 hypothetical protein CRV08_09115 [Halarcobacter ebronensis]RXK08620.1 hypothetical protein CRV07_02110 [Halarcobacter ebronensis]